jgi:hypothetical protein
MLRIATGAGAAVLLVLAVLFFWKSRAAADEPVPPAPRAELAASAYGQGSGGFAGRAGFRPPEASERSKAEKRFARADRNKDGRIVLAELLEPRRKAFARLDSDRSGQLSFEEWTGKTGDKFAEADSDHSGWLNTAEYAATAPKPKPKPKCGC